MLILQRKTGSGIPSPPLTSSSLVSDPSIDNAFQPHDIRFKPDGLVMYIVGYKTPGIDRSYVYQYDLSTAWDVTTQSYNGKFIQTTSQNEHMGSLEFKPDGLKMYTGDLDSSVSQVHEYDLSVAWDVSTATYSGNSTGDVRPGIGGTNTVHGLYIKPDDGSRMYISGVHSNQEIQQYTLSTHWDISSQSYDASSTNVIASYPTSIYFNPTGDWVYMLDYDYGGSMVITQHGLVIPWAISTVATAIASVDLTTDTSAPFGLTFSASGHRMYFSDVTTKAVTQYTLGTDWMISTTNLS